MLKAVYYARVSTDAQKDEGTIKGQIDELRKQIIKDGNVQVGEYIDDGWSGGRLDRPALDRLMGDLKTDLFDVVYFLDSDRIARNVDYQRLIIYEILKHNKKLIIKGKDYVENPENKLNLTILGAVNEFEKSKIVERMSRGRRSKAYRGIVVSGGTIFGYDYHRKTDQSDAYLTINETNAAVVRLIFETYARTTVSLTGMIRFLEKRNIKTATGKSYWKSGVIRNMLINPAYYGQQCFNRSYKVESEKIALKYQKTAKTSTRFKNESEWIYVPIPAIVSKELFDTVQVRMKRNARLLRNSDGRYLLSGLIKCGVCNHMYSGTDWKGKRYYHCNYRDKLYHHQNVDEMIICKNQGIKSEQIENIIFTTLVENIFKPSVIKRHIDILKSKKAESIKAVSTAISKLEEKKVQLVGKKSRILDLYSDQLLERDQFLVKAEEISSGLKGIDGEIAELTGRKGFIGRREEIHKDIAYFCDMAKKRYEALQPLQRNQFFRTIINEVVLEKNDHTKKITIKGVIPTKREDSDMSPVYYNSDCCVDCWRWHLAQAWRSYVVASRRFIPRRISRVSAARAGGPAAAA